MEENKVVENEATEAVEQVETPNAELEVVSAKTKPSVAMKNFALKVWANIKERWRKFLVNLKRNPQRIPLLFFLVTSICWLFWLFTFSRVAYQHKVIELSGLTVFVNTLLSILILALFLNAFPKRKKPNIIMIVLLFVFIAAMLAMDIIFYINVDKFIGNMTETELAGESFMNDALTYSIAHMVLLGVSAIMLALYPLFKILLPKINTRKEVADNNIKEVIDVEDE